MERYRFHSDGTLFYITFSIVDWLPVFIAEPAFKIVTDSLTFCHKSKGLRINAYVIMPTHLHAIVFHQTFNAKLLENTLTDFRKFTGRQLADYAESHLPKCIAQTFREKAGEDRERRVWQPTRHPEQIETAPFWETKTTYLHNNPLRKGLVRRPEDWRFSSASYWESGGKIANDVPLTALEW